MERHILDTPRNYRPNMSQGTSAAVSHQTIPGKFEIDSLVETKGWHFLYDPLLPQMCVGFGHAAR